MRFLIRDAHPDDALDIAKVQIATWQAAYGDILPADHLSALPDGVGRRAQWWGERAASAEPRGHTLVVEQDREVIGFADIGPSRDPDADSLRVGELNAIYVLPHAWGRGVGRALMAEMVAALRAAGFGVATLWVLEANLRARRFYEAAGWTDDGSAKDETIGQVVVREVRYRLEIPSQS